MKTKTQLIPIFSLIFILLFTSPVFAHRMLIEVETEGLLQVKYDDNTPAGLARVELYDMDNHLIAEGETDENGYFEYSTSLTPHEIVANDGLGHRARWQEGQMDFWYGSPTWMRALLGVSFFLVIGIITHYLGNKKSSKAPKNQ